jgi:DNA-binding transcriptional regulator/RsmH inhibitor MraZ
MQTIDNSITCSITSILESIASYYQLDAETKTMVKNKHIKTIKIASNVILIAEKNNFIFKILNYY